MLYLNSKPEQIIVQDNWLLVIISFCMAIKHFNGFSPIWKCLTDKRGSASPWIDWALKQNTRQTKSAVQHLTVPQKFPTIQPLSLKASTNTRALITFRKLKSNIRRPTFLYQIFLIWIIQCLVEPSANIIFFLQNRINWGSWKTNDFRAKTKFSVANFETNWRPYVARGSSACWLAAAMVQFLYHC